MKALDYKDRVRLFLEFQKAEILLTEIIDETFRTDEIDEDMQPDEYWTMRFVLIAIKHQMHIHDPNSLIQQREEITWQ